MSQEISIKEVEITKLRLRPGDVLLVKLPKDTQHSWMQKLGLSLAKILPRNPALLICNEKVVFEVMSHEDAQKLKEAKDGREA